MTTLTEYNAIVAATMSEKELQSNVLELAKRLGWLCYHTFDSRRSQAGFPDLVMVRNGLVIFAELKREKGKLSADQEAWREQLDRADAWYVQHYLWRPSDWCDGSIAAVLG